MRHLKKIDENFTEVTGNIDVENGSTKLTELPNFPKVSGEVDVEKESADIEMALVRFFESFEESHNNIDRQWIVDRFNDEETNAFIEYMLSVLK